MASFRWPGVRPDQPAVAMAVMRDERERGRRDKEGSRERSDMVGEAVSDRRATGALVLRCQSASLNPKP
jgi:hypothetical protein